MSANNGTENACNILNKKGTQNNFGGLKPTETWRINVVSRA